VSAILGVSITSPHGIVIGGVVPEGCAAKAGIQQGDSIVEAGGTAVTCPSKLLPHVERGAESRDIELTVRRDKASAETLPTEEPDQSRPNV
jgi:S1-C subfamily serine protease